jgi:hypothetical protein
MSEVNGKRLSEDSLETERPAKVLKAIRGISRQQLPTVVLAMGFAVGTTSEDIRQALTPTGNNKKEGLPSWTIRATSCQVLSVGPKVIAKLTFHNRATAQEIVTTWNGANVDGGELQVWVTDDIGAF